MAITPIKFNELGEITEYRGHEVTSHELSEINPGMIILKEYTSEFFFEVSYQSYLVLDVISDEEIIVTSISKGVDSAKYYLILSSSYLKNSEDKVFSVSFESVSAYWDVESLSKKYNSGEMLHISEQ